jgi:hypothetical protein
MAGYFLILGLDIMLTKLLSLLQLASDFLQVNLYLLILGNLGLELNFFVKLLAIENFILLQEYGTVALYHLLKHDSKFYSVSAYRIEDIDEGMVQLIQIFEEIEVPKLLAILLLQEDLFVFVRKHLLHLVEEARF